MWILEKSKAFFTASVLLVAVAIVGLFVQGLNKGIEFTGGSVLEIQSEEIESAVVLKESVSIFEEVGSVQDFGEGYLIRTTPLSEEKRQEIVAVLETEYESLEVIRFDSIGPSVGQELARKSLLSIILVMIAIIAFVAYAFRRKTGDSEREDSQQKGPAPWVYGVTAVIALVHDVMIPLGVYVWAGLEVNTLFVVGLLSILGLSVNDTIVVFDRIRENLQDKDQSKATFAEITGKSLKETIARSINTSLTLVVVLLVLFVVGPESTKGLALVMIVGTIVGTYSSIFLASPLLVRFAEKKEKDNK